MMKAVALLISAAVAAGVAAGQGPAPKPVLIQVNLAEPAGSYKPILSWFGYDESNYTTMQYGKQLLSELHDLSPVSATLFAPTIC